MITIIIIIILATVTINMAFGNNGLIKQAELARDMAANSTKHETESMANLTAYLNEVMNEDAEIPLPEPTNEVDPGPIEPEEPTLPDGWDGSKVTPEESDDGVIVPIPDGFEPSEEEGTHNVNDGFVITDGTNEFVWIPVNSEQLAKMYTETDGKALSGSSSGVDATTTVYGTLRKSDGSGESEGGIPGSTDYREPDILTNTNDGDASTNSSRGIAVIKSVFGYDGTNAEVLDKFAEMLVANYEEAYESIKKYGGFYIGRYELTGSIDAPTVQKAGTVTSANWYQLYKACSNVVENSDSAKTTMIAGTQWDRILEWLVETGMEPSDVYEDSSSWGNYRDSEGEAATNSGRKRPAGYNEAWQANNIYDLAGNCFEWTQEADLTNCRVSRGGLYELSSSDYPAFNRNGLVPYDDYGGYSSRPVLYVAL